MDKKALILANGRPPKKRLLRSLLKETNFFVCADGGANTAASLGLKPNLIIGDLDSIRGRAIRKFSRVPARRINDQNSTDLEKAITYLVRKGFKDIIVIGATGGRLDHAVGNLSVLAKFSKAARTKFVDDEAEVSYIGNEFHFEAPKGTIVSLIPLSLCEGIVTKGLKWELRNETLELGFREGTSNKVVSSPVHIRVRRGDLLLFRVLQEPQSKKRKKKS